ncbi:MAG: metal-sensitive transcriptional regulator [Spirochaetia bacterium]|jgi:DNA-binding FrmR family transcriptional regulator|nr:metal-sensitive transcriptional regulator [Spirochaetia bacterium]
MTKEKRTAHHPYETKSDMIVRLKKIEGQIRGISKMIEENIYCDDILNQFLSVDAAINGVRKTLLEAHMKSCIVDQIQEGKLQVIDELITTIGKMTK